MANSINAPSVGVFARSRFDWSLSVAMGGTGILSAAVGVYSAVALYNNSQQGNYIAIYGLYLDQGSVSGYVTGKPIQGPYGTLQGPGNPLVVTYPQQPGLIYTNQPATLPFTDGLFYTGFGSPLEIQLEYPLHLLPPGYSYVFCTSVTDTTLQASLIWAIY